MNPDMNPKHRCKVSPRRDCRHGSQHNGVNLHYRACLAFIDARAAHQASKAKAEELGPHPALVAVRRRQQEKVPLLNQLDRLYPTKWDYRNTKKHKQNLFTNSFTTTSSKTTDHHRTRTTPKIFTPHISPFFLARSRLAKLLTLIPAKASPPLHNTQRPQNPFPNSHQAPVVNYSKTSRF